MNPLSSLKILPEKYKYRTAVIPVMVLKRNS